MNLAGALLQSGQIDTAIVHYRHAITLRPDISQPHLRLAEALQRSGEDSLAADHLETAIQLNPRDARSVLRLAWLRATSPDATARNGKQAVHLARQLNIATRNRDARVLDTLAAAYAEVGQYADAVRTAEQALQVIGPKAKDVAAVIDGRLELYRANTKYREPTN